MHLDHTHEERPQPDHRDYLEIGQDGDDDDSFSGPKSSWVPEPEPTITVH